MKHEIYSILPVDHTQWVKLEMICSVPVCSIRTKYLMRLCVRYMLLILHSVFGYNTSDVLRTAMSVSLFSKILNTLTQFMNDKLILNASIESNRNAVAEQEPHARLGCIFPPLPQISLRQCCDTQCHIRIDQVFKTISYTKPKRV